METILEMARGAIGSGGLDRLAALTHEPPDKTRRGFEEALPVSIVGLADRVASADGAQDFLRNLKSGNFPQIDARDIGRTTADPAMAQRLVSQAEGASSQLFGNRTVLIVDKLARDSGVSAGTAKKLLGIATAMVMGIVGKTVVSRNLDAAGLGRYLREQGRSASTFVPGTIARQVEPAVKEIPIQTRRARAEPTVGARRSATRGLGRYLPWILGALVLLGLVMWVMGRRNRAAIDESRQQTAPAEMQRASPPARGTEPVERTAPAVERPATPEPMTR